MIKTTGFVSSQNGWFLVLKSNPVNTSIKTTKISF